MRSRSRASPFLPPPMSSSLASQVESVLFFKSEPVTLTELTKLLGISKGEVEETLSHLEKSYEGRGITLVKNGDEVSLGTSRENAELIEQLQKDELSRDLGRAGLETLAIILYRGAEGAAVSRREIDLIRGVNSSFILRSLLIRGLVERMEEGRGFTYKPTLKLLEYLGVSNKESLPDYAEATKALSEFLKTEPSDGTA